MKEKTTEKIIQSLIIVMFFISLLMGALGLEFLITYKQLFFGGLLFILSVFNAFNLLSLGRQRGLRM